MAGKNPLDSQQVLILDLALSVLQHTKGRWSGDEVLEFVYLLEEVGGEVFRPKPSCPELGVVHNYKEVESED